MHYLNYCARRKALRLVLYFLPVFVAILFNVHCYGDSLEFIGVSQRHSNRDETIQLALEDAARKLSFFNSISAHSANWDHRGVGSMDINIGFDYRLQYDDDLEPFLNALTFDPIADVFEYNNAVFVVARTVSSVSMPSAKGHSFENRRPVWIDSPPAEIDGYVAGVGFSGRLSSHRDTVVSSYERAVVEIIENMGSHIFGELQVHQKNYSAFGFSAASSGGAVTSGTLKNFYVIESWTDPTNLSVWTLAVASRGEE